MKTITQKAAIIFIRRVLVTIGVLLFMRVGPLLPVPGIHNIDLAFYLQNHSVTRNLVSTFSGNDTFVIGLFTLNIFPYLNATILIQILIGLFPEFAKLQKEGDLQGRRSINLLTRLITLIFAIGQSIALSLYLKQVLFDWTYSLAFEIVVFLTTGAMIVLWLSELITDYGFGNGTSILIYTNIISNVPNLIKKIILEDSPNLNTVSQIEIILLIFFSICGIVLLQEGTRGIPLVSSKELNQTFFITLGPNVNYLPIRFNQAGVMPIILSTGFLVVPNYIAQLNLFQTTNLNLNLPFNSDILAFIYWISYFALILLFTSYYSSLVLNSRDIADQFEKMSVSVQSTVKIRQGLQTRFYLKQVMQRTTWIGSIMLALLVTVPNFIESSLNITNLNGFGTTSILILAGVIIDLSREIKNFQYSNIYNDKY
jgi:preprotein translocase subunit SecY